MLGFGMTPLAMRHAGFPHLVPSLILPPVSISPILRPPELEHSNPSITNRPRTELSVHLRIKTLRRRISKFFKRHMRKQGKWVLGSTPLPPCHLMCPVKSLQTLCSV